MIHSIGDIFKVLIGIGVLILVIWLLRMIGNIKTSVFWSIVGVIALIAYFLTKCHH
jgi:hypothetical protein